MSSKAFCATKACPTGKRALLERRRPARSRSELYFHSCKPRYAASAQRRSGRGMPYARCHLPYSAPRPKAPSAPVPSRTVREGTGADGAFGLGAEYGRWQRAYGIPRPLRRWADAAYRGLQLWKYNSLLERAGRLLSRSARLPVGHAFVAQNAFEDIAYTTPQNVQAELERAVQSIEAMSSGTEARDQLSWLDLVWVCA